MGAIPDTLVLVIAPVEYNHEESNPGAYLNELLPHHQIKGTPMARFLFSFLLFVLVVGAASAQSSPIYVKWMDRDGHESARALHERIADAFNSELVLRGYPNEGQGMELFFTAQEVLTSDGSLVFMSLVESFPLREDVIEAGAKSQIWYAGRDEVEHPEEGRWVREYMTREVLTNHVHIENIEQLAFPKTELSVAISSYFDNLAERRRCSMPDVQCG